MHARERIILVEDGADLLRDVVEREPTPTADLHPVGWDRALRGEYETSVGVGCVAPEGRVA